MHEGSSVLVHPVEIQTSLCLCILAEVIKIMLNSAEHITFPAINVKMPTIVGISTFMSRKNSILGLPEPENVQFLDNFIPMSIHNFMLS